MTVSAAQAEILAAAQRGQDHSKVALYREIMQSGDWKSGSRIQLHVDRCGVFNVQDGRHRLCVQAQAGIDIEYAVALNVN